MEGQGLLLRPPATSLARRVRRQCRLFREDFSSCSIHLPTYLDWKIPSIPSSFFCLRLEANAFFVPPVPAHPDAWQLGTARSSWSANSEDAESLRIPGSLLRGPHPDEPAGGPSRKRIRSSQLTEASCESFSLRGQGLLAREWLTSPPVLSLARRLQSVAACCSCGGLVVLIEFNLCRANEAKAGPPSLPSRPSFWIPPCLASSVSRCVERLFQVYGMSLRWDGVVNSPKLQ